MELTKTSLYSPEDLIELLKTSGAPLSKIADETSIPEPTLKNYKYGKTLIDSMPYRIVVELSRFFRQYDVSIEKLKWYGHVILPEDVDSTHFEYTFGNEFKENPYLYALRVLHLFTSRYHTFGECCLFKQECSFEHVFVAISPEIVHSIIGTYAGSLFIHIHQIFERMASLNITCIWLNSAFKDFSRYFNNQPNKYDVIELCDSSLEIEELLFEMKTRLFTKDYQLDELEYVEEAFSNVAIQYLLVLFGINPARYDDYRKELSARALSRSDHFGEGLFAEKRVKAEYEQHERISSEFNSLNIKEAEESPIVKRFQLQMELYRNFDLEISQKYNFDEMLRKGTYEKLFE